MNRRTVRFASRSVIVQSQGQTADQIVEFLFGEFPISGQDDTGPECRVIDQEDSGQLCLQSTGYMEYRDTSMGRVAVHLLDRVGFHLVNLADGGLLLHAACVTTDGHATVLPGPSGSGKSSLAAWMTLFGSLYQTDELVYFPNGSNLIWPFRRPWHMKQPFPSALEGFSQDARRLGRVLDYSNGLLLSLNDCERTATTLSFPIQRLVFPVFRPGSSPQIEKLTPAQSALNLMGCLINARNLVGHGIDEIAMLSRLPAWRVIFHDLRDLEMDRFFPNV